MNRRNFITTVISAIAASPVLSIGAPLPQGSALGSTDSAATHYTNPYDSISPVVSSDAKSVRFFFSYECPHCRSYHNGLMQWGKTLPATIQFYSTPLITSDSESQVMSVYGRLIAQMIDPAILPMYDLVIYQKVQGDGQGFSGKNIDVNDALSAIVEAGVSPEKVQSVISKGRLMSAIESKIPEHSKAIATYGIKSTPSVSIFGRYIITPDHALGNPAQYLSLLNGMVSRAMGGNL